MDLRELETLSTVIEAGGFNRAAKRLAVTQSAVSQTIARMESKYGTPLIVRGTPPSLTPAGKRVMQFAERMIVEANALERDLTDIGRHSRGRVKIGASQGVTNLYLPGLLSGLFDRYPGISLDVANLASRELVLRVKRGALELGFGVFERSMDDFVTHPYGRETMKLYASAKHPAYLGMRQGDEKALKRALLLTSFLDPIENRPARQRLRYRFAGVWQVVSSNLRIELISRGLGVGYLPDHLVARSSESARLHHVSEFEHSAFEREIGLYFAKRRDPSVVACDFIAYCDEYFAERPMS